MSGSSSSSPPRGTEVSSSRQPAVTRRDKTVSSSSRQAARPAQRTRGRSALARCPAGRAPPRCKDPRPAKPTPRDGRRSGRRPLASFTTAPTVPTLTPCRDVDRGGGRRTQCRHRARRWRWSLVLPRITYSHYLSGPAGPRMFTCPLLRAGAAIQPEPSQRLGAQPLSERGSVLPPSRRRSKAGQPPSWLARSAQLPSRARWATR
jgi:hypothetical protein